MQEYGALYTTMTTFICQPPASKLELRWWMHLLALFDIQMQIILVSQTKLYLLTAELRVKKYELRTAELEDLICD